MNIDIIIANPPYQDDYNINGGSAKALFDLFIDMALGKSARVVSMITPTKWISGKRSNMENIRTKLVTGNHLRYMVDFMRSSDIFDNVTVAGGVSYFVYDKEYIGNTDWTTVLSKNFVYRSERDIDIAKTNNIITRHAVADSVIYKSSSKHKMSDVTYKDNWGMTTNFRGRTSKQEESDLKLETPDGISYISRDDIVNKEIDTYKVMFTRVVTGHGVAPSSKDDYVVLSSLKVINPGEVCNASYMTIMNNFKEKEEAENIVKYLKTKFARFLILQTLFGIGLTPERFYFVPMQNFKSDSDINWSSSIEDINNQLYNKYKLDSNEINYINRIIRYIE